MAGSLKDYEVEQLMRAYEERRKKAVRARERRASGGSGTGGGAGGGGSSGPGRGTGGGGPGAKGNRSTPSSPVGPAPPTPPGSTTSEDDSLCPICLMCMVEGESLVRCESGCRNTLHHQCMAVWAADRHTHGQPLLCPLCRAPWPTKYHPPRSSSSVSPLVTSPSPSPSPPPAVLTATTTKTTTSSPRVPSIALSDHAYTGMSASFSGMSLSARQQSSSSNSLMSLSMSAAYSLSDSAYSSPAGGPSLGSPYPPTVKSEVCAAVVASASEEAVPLPRTEPIPAEHEAVAAAWVAVFGSELVSCLFSRDWAVRETGLRRLVHEVVKVLHWDRLVTGEEKQRQVINCCANILAQVANDPVYKVYLACLRCVRVLLSHLCPTSSDVSSLQELLRPLVRTLLLKCADGNRRTSQISVDSIVELCRGQQGELALGSQVGSSHIHCTPGLGGISYVLSCILDDSPPSEAPWQWLLGRLCVLDRLLDEFPGEFQLQYVPLMPSDSGYKLEHYDRLMTVVEFAFKALGSSHATVSKLARRVYICGARFAAAEPAVFHQVCDMLAKLDVSLQMRLKRRLRSLQGQNSERKTSLARLEGKFSGNELGDQIGSRLVRSVSHSPSRMLGILRSSSQSPARKPLVSPTPMRKVEASSGGERSQSILSPTSSPPRPTHLPLDSFEAKFKEKQAKLRLYHKTRPRPEVPLVVQNVLISPGHRTNKKWSPIKSGAPLYKGGLSHSYGDVVNVSPQTPIRGLDPPQFTFRDAVSTPATPSAPTSTPVREETPITPTILRNPPLPLTKVEVKEVDDFSLARGLSISLHETPLPSIPGLEILPSDESVHPYGTRLEGREYKEGRDWVRGPLLGTGAFSSCYQGRDVRTGTLMAVKQVSFCRNSEEEQEQVEATVEEEILLMSRLQHPNIVRLLGATQHSTSFSVFTEWMAGGSVATMLEKYGSFSEAVILRYTRQVLSGLAYLHDNMILHRDLKGANLLVDSTGQWLRIGDFGTAARLASKSTVTGEFQGQLLGTIAFMAPEVLRGEDYGRSCDVWSVGCCMLEMATTKPPWGADNVSNQWKLMFKIATSSGPPDVPDHMTPPTRDLVLRCLEICSENRPPAKELLAHPCFNMKECTSAAPTTPLPAGGSGGSGGGGSGGGGVGVGGVAGHPHHYLYHKPAVASTSSGKPP